MILADHAFLGSPVVLGNVIFLTVFSRVGDPSIRILTATEDLALSLAVSPEEVAGIDTLACDLL